MNADEFHWINTADGNPPSVPGVYWFRTSRSDRADPCPRYYFVVWTGKASYSPRADRSLHPGFAQGYEIVFTTEGIRLASEYLLNIDLSRNLLWHRITEPGV